MVLPDYHNTFWRRAYDLLRGTYYCLPLFILLGIVLKWGFNVDL